MSSGQQDTNESAGKQDLLLCWCYHGCLCLQESHELKSKYAINTVVMYRRIFQFTRPVDDYEEMVGDDLDLLEDGQLVPDSESDDNDD